MIIVLNDLSFNNNNNIFINTQKNAFCENNIFLTFHLKQPYLFTTNNLGHFLKWKIIQSLKDTWLSLRKMCEIHDVEKEGRRL